jgi:hypothetical protein
MLQALRASPNAASVFPFGHELHYSDRRPESAPGDRAANVQSGLRAAGFADAEVTPTEPGIEDAFMELMGAPDDMSVSGAVP